MKTALCIAGQMRTFDKVFPSLKKFLIDVLKPDIFISTWSKTGKTHKLRTCSTNEADDVLLDDLKQLTEAKIIDIEPFNEEYYNSFNGITRPEYLMNHEPIHSRSMIPHFYKIHRCNMLKNTYSIENQIDYDCVIRLRPDLLLKNSIEALIPKINLKNSAYVSLCELNPSFQISDKFVLMDNEVSNYYSSVWERLEDYWKRPYGKNPPKTNRVGERLMFEHMNQQKINIKFFNLGSKILR